jgi:hypothetical protein
MTRMSAYIRRHGVSILVLIAMAAIWQLLSMAYTAEAVPGEPMIPGWQVVFTRTLISLADYWQGGLGVDAVAEGAPPTYLAALLAIVTNSFDTIVRLCSAASWARFWAWQCPGRDGRDAPSLCRCNSSAACHSSPWFRCSSFGSAPTSLVRSLSWPME